MVGCGWNTDPVKVLGEFLCSSFVGRGTAKLGYSGNNCFQFQSVSLQCSDTVGWATGRASGL